MTAERAKPVLNGRVQIRGYDGNVQDPEESEEVSPDDKRSRLAAF